MSQTEHTEVFFEVFKGSPVLAIWKIDRFGNKMGQTPVVSFGQKKALAIIEHLEEIQEWVRQPYTNMVMPSSAHHTVAPSAPPTRSTIDLSSLTPGQQATLKSLLTQIHK